MAKQEMVNDIAQTMLSDNNLRDEVKDKINNPKHKFSEMMYSSPGHHLGKDYLNELIDNIRETCRVSGLIKLEESTILNPLETITTCLSDHTRGKLGKEEAIASVESIDSIDNAINALSKSTVKLDETLGVGVKLTFSQIIDGETKYIKRYLFVPIIAKDGTITISNNTSHIQPVMIQKVISIADDGYTLFIRYNNARINVKRINIPMIKNGVLNTLFVPVTKVLQKGVKSQATNLPFAPIAITSLLDDRPLYEWINKFGLLDSDLRFVRYGDEEFRELDKDDRYTYFMYDEAITTKFYVNNKHLQNWMIKGPSFDNFLMAKRTAIFVKKDSDTEYPIELAKAMIPLMGFMTPRFKDIIPLWNKMMEFHRSGKRLSEKDAHSLNMRLDYLVLRVRDKSVTLEVDYNVGAYNGRSDIVSEIKGYSNRIVLDRIKRESGNLTGIDKVVNGFELNTVLAGNVTKLFNNKSEVDTRYLDVSYYLQYSVMVNINNLLSSINNKGDFKSRDLSLSNKVNNGFLHTMLLVASMNGSEVPLCIQSDTSPGDGIGVKGSICYAEEGNGAFVGKSASGKQLMRKKLNTSSMDALRTTVVAVRKKSGYSNTINPFLQIDKYGKTIVPEDLKEKCKLVDEFMIK